MALTDKIIGVESSGRRHAKNPRSSAYGPGQFISSTWLDMISRYRPDLKEGRTRAEILELRSDPDISREMTDAYARENAAYLRSRGLPVDDGTTYLSHFAGPEGAESLLKNPNLRADQVLSAGAIKANPFLKDWTAQEVINWAAKKMGGKPTATANIEPPHGILNEASITSDGGPTAALARSIGYGETGGMLDTIFGDDAEAKERANRSMLTAATLASDVDNSFQEGGASDGGITNVDQNALAGSEAMTKQALAAMMQPRSQNVDMTRLAQILQRRASLGV